MVDSQQLLRVPLVKIFHKACKNKTNFEFFRVSLTCACSMHLALFPLDEQTCYLNIASCEYPRHYRHHHHRCLCCHNYYQFSLSSCYLNIASCEHLRHLCDHLNNYHLHHLVIYVIIFVIINPTNFPAVFFGIFHGTRLVE